MNKNKVKLALHSTENDIDTLINKFLDADVFNFIDICWWWDPSKNWWQNKKYAKVVLNILIKERCCRRVAKAGGFGYKKTEEFIGLLQEMLRIEKLTRGVQ